MDRKLPNAKSARSAGEREKLRRVVARRGLTGLANDTKWDEFISAMRARSEWRPSYRFKCIDGQPSDWDVEWFYHLPFPLMSVEWLDVAHLQEIRAASALPRKVIDHADWIEASIQQAGLDYRKGAKLFRIFGYSPRDSDLFDE